MAAPRAVTSPIGSAGSGALVDTGRIRGPRSGWYTAAERVRAGAGHTGAPAGAVAADAVHTIARSAIGPCRASLAVAAWPTGSSHTGGSGRALVVGRASRGAAIPHTHGRCTRNRHPRDTGANAVARRGRDELRRGSGASAQGADRTHGVFGASTLSIAEAAFPTGFGGIEAAYLVWIRDPCRRRAALAHELWQGTAHARTVAGQVAAHAIGAETRGAFGPTGAGHPHVRLHAARLGTAHACHAPASLALGVAGARLPGGLAGRLGSHRTAIALGIRSAIRIDPGAAAARAVGTPVAPSARKMIDLLRATRGDCEDAEQDCDNPE